MPPEISGSTAASTRRPDDRDLDNLPAIDRSRLAGQRTASALVPTRAVEALVDEDVAHAVRNFANAPKPNDGILYVGLNSESATAEAAALRRSGAPVTTVAREDGAAKSAKDLVADIVAQNPGLDARVVQSLTAALEGATPEGRDELAKIAAVWVRGEMGQSIPSRLVVSGHHGGDGFIGSMRESDIVALARALPNAAKQIEDTHFAGCMTEANVTLHHDLTEAFPNLRTIWGYSGFSPSAPLHHLSSWERATRGRADAIRSSSVPAHENAVAWSRSGGVVGKQKPLAELESDCQFADGRLDAFKSGRLTEPEAANIDYEAYRGLAQSSSATPAQRADASAKADVLLRVRKYAHVREHFAKAYGERIATACAKAGITPVPDFATLSRKDAVERIAEIRARVVAAEPELGRVLDGLVKLDSSVKEEWCQ